MKTLLKIIAGLVTLLLALGLGAFAAVNLVSWNAYKGMITDRVRAATGRDLIIEGNLDGHLSMAGALQVKADAAFANAMMPNGNTISFGSTAYTGDAPDTEGYPSVKINASVVFGNLKIKQ